MVFLMLQIYMQNYILCIRIECIIAENSTLTSDIALRLACSFDTTAKL